MLSMQLKKYRNARGVTQKDLADFLGVSQQAIAKWETDKATPDPYMLEKISDYFCISIDELIGKEERRTIGKRLKFFRERAGYNQLEFAKKINISNSTLSQYEAGNRGIDDTTKIEIAKLLNISIAELFGESNNPASKGVKIPVLGRVIAGIPIEAITEILDYEEIPEEMARNGEYFALKIKGDSMAPRIKEGDVVIVRKQDTVENKEVAIVLVNGNEATIKEVHFSQFGLTLVGWNVAEYQPHFYPIDEVENLPVRIIGKVVELRGKF